MEHNLWVNSCYSFLSSSILLEDYVNYAIKKKWKWISLTDINTTTGLFKFQELCKINNLKAIFGIEYKKEDLHLLIIAKNNNGLNLIFKISSYLNDSYYLKTKFLHKQIFNSFKLNADVWLFVINDFSNTETKNFLQKCFKNCFLTTNLKFKKMCLQNISVLNDWRLFKILNAIKKKEINEIDFYNNYELPKNKYYFESNGITLEELIESSNAEIDTNNLQNFFVSNNKAKEIVTNLAFDGLKQRFKNISIPLNYISRLKYELQIIDKLKFFNYLLVVYDYVQYIHNNGILIGPGRGSSAGSLLCYCLRITNIDPIKYNLFFERFINTERTNFPDIDIDIADNKRQQVLNYIMEKYSNFQSAQISTYSKMTCKSAIRDIFRIIKFDFSYNLDLELKKLFSIQNLGFLNIHEKNNELLINKIINSKIFIHFCSKNYVNSRIWNLILYYLPILCKYPRNFNIHAAGVVISKNDLSKTIGIMVRNNQIITQFEAKDLAKLNFFKMDILGLRNLTLIFEILKNIYINQNKIININNINLNERFIFDKLKTEDLSCIFQLESAGMQKLVRNYKPTKFEDLILIISLYRPGPKTIMNELLNTRNGKQKINYINNELKEITKDTYGFLIYQEQIIQGLQILTNLSPNEADLFRYAISKKKFNLIDKFKTKIIQSGISKNYSKEFMHKIYELLVKFTNYGFNKAHATCYALIAYWTVYLKFKYPKEFAISLINTNSPKSKIFKIFEFLKKNNYKILLPSILKSLSVCYFDKLTNKIILPFWIINGIGEILINKILKIKRIINIENLKSTLFHLLQNITQSQFKLLINAGTFDCYLVNRFILLDNIEVLYSWAKLNDENIDLPIDINTKIFKVSLKEKNVTKKLLNL